MTTQDDHKHATDIVSAARILGLPVETVRTAGDRLVVVQRVDLDLDTDVRARDSANA